MSLIDQGEDVRRRANIPVGPVDDVQRRVVVLVAYGCTGVRHEDDPDTIYRMDT